MATARDLIERALKRARIVGTGETPGADEVADAVEVFNDMLEAWLDEGIRHGLREVTLATELAIDRGTHRAIVDNLAVELADNAGIKVSAILAGRAERGRASLVGRYFGSPDARIDAFWHPRARYDIESG